MQGQREETEGGCIQVKGDVVQNWAMVVSGAQNRLHAGYILKTSNRISL
jgi:hypothetical protein